MLDRQCLGLALDDYLVVLAAASVQLPGAAHYRCLIDSALVLCRQLAASFLD